MATREEIDRSIERAVDQAAKMADLRATAAVLELKNEIIGWKLEIQEKTDRDIKDCQALQNKRRRFNVQTIVSTLLALGAMAVAIFKG